MKFFHLHKPVMPGPFFLIFLLLLQVGACINAQKKSRFQVKFLNEQILKKDRQFEGLSVGGLSALTFDEGTGEFLALSDDKLNHRFYRLQLQRLDTSDTQQKKKKWTAPFINNKNNSPSFQFILKEQVLLREKNSKNMNRNMDPEGLALKDQTLFITSEGQQIFNPPEPPQIFIFSKAGILKKAWSVPSVFWNKEKFSSVGARENKGFESLTLTEKYLWTATEKALKQDMNRLLRLSGFGLKTGKLLRQYPYFLDFTAGLSEMIAITDKIFLTLERAYDKKTGENQVWLFVTHCREATDLMTLPDQSLKYSVHLKSLVPAVMIQKTKSSLRKLTKSNRIIPCNKDLLFDFSKLPPGVTADNLEGMTLGPKISQGGQLLVFTSDNNFSSSQKTQFLFFRISPVINSSD
ncbi:MAG: esterase-like activity of phytase family protein [Bdellovibrionales bacterium]|nr:esterase-like activity of phytase family protein [Bdellovibrionales bacterium]